jgi:hypothetical protein
LTTAQNTREWTAIHRKHHAKCETVDDPHSPVIKGLSTGPAQRGRAVPRRGGKPRDPAHLRQELPGRLDRAQTLHALSAAGRCPDGRHRPCCCSAPSASPSGRSR